ncbi:ABC-2 type transport system permease protein [Streptomyces radiopugnans]|uniref:ABC-2 type transport system permease protein n=1 Tax=Streptomyces radiopugnans TaxID=403935 RepID=A0A1H9B3J0_9ACTN|nr:ABC-2 type transport system permease protein [Streptomyces radiopugnans]
MSLAVDPTAAGRLRRWARAWCVAWRITRLNFRAQLEYRAEFLMSVGMGVAWQSSVIVFATVLLQRFPGMGGWSGADVLLIVGMRMLAHALYVLLFGRVHSLSFLVQEGRLDACLLRPMPVYRQIQLSVFPTHGLGDLAVGATMFAFAVQQAAEPWTAGRAVFLAAGVAGGMLVEAAVFTAVSCAALRFPSAFYWSTWVDELMATFGSYPLSILPKAVSGVFTFVLPLAFVAYLPAGVLTGHGAALGVPFWLAAASPAVGLALFVAARLLWNRSLRHYTGVNG